MLSQKDEFLLTLMKLRLGSTSADLAQRFGIGTTTVSNVFTTWITILSKELGFLVYNLWAAVTAKNTNVSNNLESIETA